MQHRPAAARTGFQLGAHKAFAADTDNGGFQVGDLEEQDRLVARGIVLRSLSLQANEAAAAVEFGEVSGMFVRNFEPKDGAVEALCGLDVVEVELNAREAQIGAHNGSPVCGTPKKRSTSERFEVCWYGGRLLRNTRP